MSENAEILVHIFDPNANIMSTMKKKKQFFKQNYAYPSNNTLVKVNK